MCYMVVVEWSEGGWGANVPDLSGCVAAAEAREEVVELIREAIEFHLEGLREEGEVAPQPNSDFEFVEVDAAWRAPSVRALRAPDGRSARRRHRRSGLALGGSSVIT